MAMKLGDGVHLVGSIRLPTDDPDPLINPSDAERIFKIMTRRFPGRLRRLPDGETGYRSHSSSWQNLPFLRSPWIMDATELREAHISLLPEYHMEVKGRAIEIGPTGYDFAAVKSWEAFERLQKQGVIAPNTRFQVCLPTPMSIIAKFVKPEYREDVEHMYEDALIRAIRSIEAQIPHRSLAIQIDAAVELPMLEGARDRLNPWFELTMPQIVERMKRIVGNISLDVEIGFHLCYGDINHRHFIEPVDTTNLTLLANSLTAAVPRPINWFHIPVPKARTDRFYFEPLADLRLHPETELYLGLVHARDFEGTIERIITANWIVPDFGIATECGWGRTEPRDIVSIIDITNALSTPVDGSRKESVSMEQSL